MGNKKEIMFNYVEQWLSSGLSQKKFAVKHSIQDKTLCYWNAKHLREVRSKQFHKESLFVELTVPEKTVELPIKTLPVPKLPQLYMELELPEGLRFKIYR